MDSFFSENEVSKDSLTGVYSKKTLSSYISHLILQTTAFSFALLDVDNFSYFNEAFGREGGDKVLCDIAKTLSKIIGEKGIVARTGGDEFAFVLKDTIIYDEVWSVCHNLMVKINEIEIPEVENQSLTITLGIARFPENAENISDLTECVEKALYRGKSKGRNCFIIYLPEKHASIVPKNEKQRAIGSLNLHSNVYKYLTSSEDLKTGIQNLFNFFSSYFEIDHICIQSESSDSELFFQKLHQRAKNKEFSYIPHDLILQSMNKQTGVLYIGDAKNLLKTKHDALYELFGRQEITSSCICEIIYNNVLYGMIRFDMTGDDSEKRILQYADTDLFLTTARTIALILHYSGKKLEDL